MKVEVKIFDYVIICTINAEFNSYIFKTPKAWGGRYYASFCNQLDDAFSEQYPEIHSKLIKNQNL